jgi:GGDEF domain-containing protein
VLLAPMLTALVYRYVGVETAPRFFGALPASTMMINVMLSILNDLQDALTQQANTDALTGAFNRRSLGPCVAEMIERRRRHGAPASLLLIDIDHFKRVNDRFGHHGGDEVLRALVQATPMVDEPVTVSIGVAGLDDGQTQDQWLRRADGALYAAKNAGRNRVVAAGDGVGAEAPLATATR